MTSCIILSQLEIGPAALNHTEHTVSTLGSVVVGEPGRPVEDLEGELEKKIRLLEKERKNLRKETQSHHQHIDQGLNTLQERIAELEQSKEEGWVQLRGKVVKLSLDFKLILLIFSPQVLQITVTPKGINFPSPCGLTTCMGLSGGIFQRCTPSRHVCGSSLPRVELGHHFPMLYRNNPMKLSCCREFIILQNYSSMIR